MKSLSCLGSAAAVAGGLTQQDWLFILGLVVTIINALIEYLRYRSERDASRSGS